MLKLDATEVEQLEPDLQDHYSGLCSLATAPGKGFMLYHRVKQASQCLLHTRGLKCKQASLYQWHIFAENPVPVLACNWVANR